ncbi:hypothetical protein ASE48_01055 [Mycobacterium sp. Root265]|uniref:GAP family protein n=1 Tax=Mycobacterium sp. Root265 TaxID=1736504 RepID=UPI00070A3D5B|nr:GAP family protein [Mycobacterium sp. Root265]KRD20836.1 hypothetical protein ASE48_01055 [Mycobacterium sp. Root265]
MWTTVALLGLMVSIQPVRLGPIALLMTRQHPVRHLIVLQCAGMAVSLSVGLTVLFVFRRSFLGNSNVHPAPLQVAFGLVLVLIGAVLASKIPLDRFARKPKDVVPAGGGDGFVDDGARSPSRRTRFFARARGLLKSESFAFSASIGAATSLPSVDYFALLAIIVASKASPLEQGLALLIFLVLAWASATIAILSFIVAPVKTRLWVQQVNLWIRGRTRKQAGLFVGIVGSVLVVVGLIGM